MFSSFNLCRGKMVPFASGILQGWAAVYVFVGSFRKEELLTTVHSLKIFDIFLDSLWEMTLLHEQTPKSRESSLMAAVTQRLRERVTRKRASFRAANRAGLEPFAYTVAVCLWCRWWTVRFLRPH